LPGFLNDPSGLSHHVLMRDDAARRHIGKAFVDTLDDLKFTVYIGFYRFNREE
jgi:hypothetical protein